MRFTMLACSGCKTAVEKDRLPLGWKRVGDAAYCKACFRSRYAVRAVTLPATQVSAETWAALRECWRLSTCAANWCVQQLYRRDTIGSPPAPAAVKPGRAADGRFYGYGLAAGEAFFADWSGAKQSLNICLQYAHREYLRRRWDVMVRHEQSLLTVRFPFPYPVDADAWKSGYEPGGFPVVTLTLPGATGPTTFRLKRSAEFGRQLAMFRELHSGAALKGEAALYRNRRGDLMVKLVGFFPRRPPGERVHACLLHTDPNALLVAEVDGRSPWILNADHLRRWQAVHRVYRQRMSEDMKREKRQDARQRANARKSLDLRCGKHCDRLDTAVKQLAAQVVRFCERQKVATVAYDDAVRTYIPDGFPWHALKTRLAVALGEWGIDFIATASGGVANDDETPKPPEGGGRQPGTTAATGPTARDDGGETGESRSAPAKRSRNGQTGQSARRRSRNAPKTGQRDGLTPGAAELKTVSTN